LRLLKSFHLQAGNCSADAIPHGIEHAGLA
jgi:hypothetical protein